MAEPAANATDGMLIPEDRPVFAPDAGTKPLHPAPHSRQKNKVNLDKIDINTQDLILQALTLVGVNYRYGGKTPETGLDCSGLVRYVFQPVNAMALPHNALGDQ